MCPALEQKQIDRVHGQEGEEGFYYIGSVLDGVLCVGDCTPKDEAIPVTRLMCGVDKEIGTY
jgi:hypothetical protein